MILVIKSILSGVKEKEKYPNRAAKKIDKEYSYLEVIKSLIK